MLEESLKVSLKIWSTTIVYLACKRIKNLLCQVFTKGLYIFFKWGSVFKLLDVNMCLSCHAMILQSFPMESSLVNLFVLHVSGSSLHCPSKTKCKKINFLYYYLFMGKMHGQSCQTPRYRKLGHFPFWFMISIDHMKDFLYLCCYTFLCQNNNKF